jgi:hypothetical protein
MNGADLPYAAWFSQDHDLLSSAVHGDGQEHPGPPWLPMVLRLLPLLISLHLGFMVSLFGCALLLGLLAPLQLERGVERLRAHPLSSYLLGLLLLGLLVAGMATLIHLHLRPGRMLIGALAMACLSFGFAICARILGQRALPSHAAIAQGCLGLAALILPMACPIGILVVLVAGPLGAGAWLSAACRRQTIGAA